MVIGNQHVSLVPEIQAIFDDVFGMRPVEMQIDKMSGCVFFKAEGLPILAVPSEVCEILPVRKHSLDDTSVVRGGIEALYHFKTENEGPLEVYSVEDRTLIILSVNTGAELVLGSNHWSFNPERFN